MGDFDFDEMWENTSPLDEDTPLMRAPSSVYESPFSLTGRETSEQFFSSADSTSVNGVEIISENNVSSAYVDDVSSLIGEPTSNFSVSPELIEAGYQIRVFVSKDDSYLRQAYEKTEPAPDEICIFLEDNRTDYFSDASAYIKVGDHFKKDLAKRRDIASSEAESISSFQFTNEIGNVDPDAQIAFSASEIEELIRTGKISNVSRDTLISIFQVANFGTRLLTPVYRAIGDGITWATGGIRSIVRFSEQSWDPEAKLPDGTKATENFEPALFPLSEELITLFTLGGEGVIDQAERVARQTFEAQRQIARSAWDTAMSFPGASYAIPEKIYESIEAGYQKLDELVDYLMSISRQVFEIYISVGTKWLNAVNAFLCGLWNAAVEAVLGLVDLLGMIFKGLAAAGDAINNAHDIVPQALELADEIIQTLANADLVGIARAAVNAAISKLQTTSPLDLLGDVSIERVSYYTGSFVGFVAEMAIGMMTGGASSAASLTSKLAKFGKAGADFGELISRIIGKVMSGAGSLVEQVILITRKFLEILKRGRDEVVRLVDNIFDGLQRAARLTDEMIQKIARVSGLDQALIRSLDSLGFKVASYTDNVCTICAKAS